MKLLRSLRFKLLAGFALASLTGLLLFGLLGETLTLRYFSYYLEEARVASFSGRMLSYFQHNGTWEGADTFLPVMGPGGMPMGPPGWRPSGPIDGPPPRGPGDRPPGPGGGPPDGGRPGSPRFQPRIGLVDANNLVVVKMEGLELGQKIDPLRYPIRKTLELDGQIIGIAFANPLPQLNRLRPEERAFIRSSTRTLIGAGIASLLVALVLGALIARGLLAPLQRLTKASQELAAGKFGQQLKVYSEDEVGLLTKAFNRMSADLAQADQHRRQMVADIAHDLGTPLTVASGYVQALRDNKLQPSQERFETIHDELALIGNLVDDLRLLSLADSGQLKLVKEEIQPELLLRNVHKAFQHRAQKQGVELVLEVEEGLPNLMLDSERMRQVLGNLVSNSLNYTERGEVRLIARQDGEAVVFKVSDTGKGIAGEKLPYIFERFYRADESRSSENGGGSGLGLAIAKSIVELHGGSISAQSAVGHGTTISIRIPT